MKRPILVLLSVLAPLAAHAQATTPAPGQPDTTQPRQVVATSEPAPGQVTAATPPAVQKPAQFAERRPRRRGSMVGYIEDPVVTSKIRIRFDAGFHNEVPDRAEFFYAKCGCYRQLDSTDPAFDPEAPGPGPGAASNLNFQQLYAYGEYAIRERFSVFGELPVRWIQPQAFDLVPQLGTFDNHAGISDLRAGVKVALADSDRQVISVQLRAFLPTGDSRNGLGTDHASLEPALLMYHQLTDRFSIESQIGDWHPLGGADGVPTSGDDRFAGDVFFYGIGPSYEVYRSDRVSVAPVVELVGWHVIDGFQTAANGDAGGTDIVNLKFGARVSWNGQGSFYVGYGHALTKQNWYDNILRFEFRRSF